MTSKQRAYLKGLAMTMEPILQVGKSSITPEHTEDGLAVFRLDIVRAGAPFSFIVRTQGNAAQSADLTARASSEPVLVTWDAESSGRGSATQPVPVNPEDIAGEVKARTESLFSELKAALK